MTALRVESVTKGHGAQPVLRGLDLAVPSGAALALLGPSGCGKTTLLRLIAGFDRCDAGRIGMGPVTLDDGATHLPPERRRIGYVPQEGLLFPHLTVGGNVGFGLTRAERRSGRVAEALALAGLDGFDRRFPHQLSGGQQQRAALARALAPRPGLVLLDEPFNGLDLTLRRGVAADVLGVLRAGGTTTILVTHDPAEAFAAADLVAVMQAGAILQCADPATVYRQSADLAVARQTGSVIELPGEIRGSRAETELGSIPVLPAYAVEGAAIIALRPDQVVAARSGVAARLLARDFRGDHVRVTAGVGSLRLTLRMSSFDLSDGETITLATRGACMAFPAPTTA